jgi:hypothetical protein
MGHRSFDPMIFRSLISSNGSYRAVNASAQGSDNFDLGRRGGRARAIQRGVEPHDLLVEIIADGSPSLLAHARITNPSL